MLVTAKFEDNSAFTSEDLRAALTHVFGENLVFDVEPSDKTPLGRIKFGVNELIAHDVIDIYHNIGEYDQQEAYTQLINSTSATIRDLISEVILDIQTQLEEE